MSTPRFYSWDDDGSPGRALSGNLQNRLKQILIPCLVTGYGSKPGAGWTLEHEHANGFTLSNGENYFNFVSNLPAQSPRPAMHVDVIHVYMAESLTDTSNAIINGANLCSGPYRSLLGDASPYLRHGIYVNCLKNANLQWTLVADDKTFSFSLSGAPYALYNSFTIYAGVVKNDLGIAGGGVVFGGDNGSYSSGSYTYTLSRGFTSIRNEATGLAEYSEIVVDPFNGKFKANPGSNIIGYIPANLILNPPRIAVSGSYTGSLRGIAYDDVLSMYGWPAYLRALGFSGADYGDRGKVVAVGGHQYAYADGYAGGFVMTTDPAFW